MGVALVVVKVQDNLSNKTTLCCFILQTLLSNKLYNFLNIFKINHLFLWFAHEGHFFLFDALRLDLTVYCPGRLLSDGISCHFKYQEPKQTA